MAGSGGRVLRSSDNPPRPTEESPNGPSHAESQVKKRPKPTPKKRGQHTDDAEKRSPAGAINRFVTILKSVHQNIAPLTNIWPRLRLGTPVTQ